MNFAWIRGAHNVKLGGEMKILHQNHYETQTPSFTFSGGRTALAPAGPNAFNAFADFLLGEANSRTLCLGHRERREGRRGRPHAPGSGSGGVLRRPKLGLAAMSPRPPRGLSLEFR